MQNSVVCVGSQRSEPVNAAVSCHPLVRYLQRFGARLQGFDDELPAKCVQYHVRVWTPSHRVYRTSCMRQREGEERRRSERQNDSSLWISESTVQNNTAHSWPFQWMSWRLMSKSYVDIYKWKTSSYSESAYAGA